MENTEKRKVVFSGIQPSGNITLGNYIGALRNFTLFDDADCLYCMADLHTLTVRQMRSVLSKFFQASNLNIPYISTWNPQARQIRPVQHRLV